MRDVIMKDELKGMLNRYAGNLEKLGRLVESIPDGVEMPTGLHVYAFVHTQVPELRIATYETGAPPYLGQALGTDGWIRVRSDSGDGLDYIKVIEGVLVRIRNVEGFLPTVNSTVDPALFNLSEVKA